MPFLINGLPPERAAEQHPDWADVDALRALALVPWDFSIDVPLRFGTHPLFAPWREQIQNTAALEGALVFGAELTDEQVSRAGGKLAWMSEPSPPTCGLCSEPLTICFQLIGVDLVSWLLIDGLLTAAYCFACHPDAGRHYSFEDRGYLDGNLACRITVEQPSHLVELRDSGEPARALEVHQRWAFPDLNYSSDKFGEGMATTMWKLGVEPRVEITDEYLAMVDERNGWTSPHVERLGDALLPDEVWRTKLGGFPSWDQEDVTPQYPICGAPMQLVVDYNGHQFLDGSLHIFTCVQTEACRDGQHFDFVAEF